MSETFALFFILSLTLNLKQDYDYTQIKLELTLQICSNKNCRKFIG